MRRTIFPLCFDGRCSYTCMMVCVLIFVVQGDSSNRRSGMSATLLECLAGDKVYATSDLTLTGSGDIIAQWTFSGFKVR